MTVLPSAWLRVVVTRENPIKRVICFPHSGGGVSVFSGWEALPSDMEVVVINMPGRNDRSNEIPIENCDVLVSEVCGALRESGALSLPYAFFGHSFGALVAFEVAITLKPLRTELQPLHIFASSEESPYSLSSRVLPELMYTMSDSDFLTAVNKWGYLPTELGDDASLQAAVLPSLRADIAMFEKYRGSKAKLGKETTVSVLAGRNDASLEQENLVSWAENVASSNPEVVLFEGGHFYFSESPSGLNNALSHVSSVLSSRMAALPLSIQNGGDAPHLHNPKCVWELFEERVKCSPNSVAIVDNIRGELTYSDTWKLCLKIAKQIASCSKRGATVGMMLPHSSDYVCAMFGIWIAGGCFLVLERHHPPEMLRMVCSTCNPDGSGKPDIIVTLTECLPSFTGILADVPKILLDKGWEERCDYSGYIAQPGNLDDRAILMTTSGTSGLPKLIEGSQRFQQVGMLSRTTLMPYTGTPLTTNADREACSVMFVWEAPRSLVTGHICVVIPETVIIDPIKLVEFLVEHKCTRILTTPSLANHVYDFLESNQEVTEQLQSTMKRWFFMGEVCTAKLVTQALRVVPKIQVINAYSTWEGADTTLLKGSTDYLKPYKKFYPVGELHEGVVAVVVDPATRKPVPRNVPGELFTTGPQLANGYSMAPELTAERYINLGITSEGLTGSERWYKSGDLAVMFNDGKIELHGRIDSTVKIRGFKVGLPFVEGILLDTPDVAVAVVVPTFDKESNQPDALAALISSAGDLSFNELVASIKKDIITKMPKWAAPTFYLRIEDIIEGELRQGGESKKINRRAIPKLFTKELKDRFRVKSSTPKVVREGVEGVIYNIWIEVLDLDHSFDPNDNFFELGGHSLLASTMTQKLSEATHVDISVLDLYENSTFHTLVKFVMSSSSPLTLQPTRKKPKASGSIAIVGMSGRFPGAKNIYQFWDNLKAGAVTPTYHTAEYLASKGVDPEVINHPDFVRVAYKVDEADKFDARFFGIGRTEAATMDPQHRVFIECAWNAIEHAGYAPKTGFETENTRVGVFGAAGIDGYLVHHLNGGALRTPLEPGNLFMTEVASEKDYIATRVSYLLNLRGPSMNVNSACSSALVAVSQACTSIVMGECDMAVAGAASLNFPNIGFLYQDGLVFSKDGLVKPLDESADGTAFGDSVGAVVLKRLEDAEADGDDIWGVIKGFGVSNDGNVKAGYSAPAAAGQADCISKAMAMNDTKPEDISYVEMHATGTLVGDGIEAKGLAKAWKTQGLAQSDDKWCAVGSVKGNIGHANCAAGITGLIKTVMMLKHQELVPVANYTKLNEKVLLDGTPFYVNDKARHWEAPKNGVRTAGVSSFGIGGTNAHVIVGEYSKKVDKTPPSAAYVTLQFSAKSQDSLSGTIADFSAYITSDLCTESLVDVAHTLRTGREQFMVRSTVTVKANATKAELKQALQSAAPVKAVRKPILAFLCPGQGSQYLGMAKGLCALPTFKKHFDDCCERLTPLIGRDLRSALFNEDDMEAFKNPAVLQPSLFTVEYCVAKLLMSAGVTPSALAGHSIGEYVAAVLGNHISLDSALRIVATRATATSADVQEGAMLSVGMDEEVVRAAIKESVGAEGLWLAAVNSPIHAVVSGTLEAVAALEIEMRAKGVKVTKLHVNRAFHSELMKPAGDKLLAMTFEEPEGDRIPMTSNVTGGWADDTVRTGVYWKRHMEDTVMWKGCAKTLIQKAQPQVCVEVGPGGTLSILGNKCCEQGMAKPTFEQSMRHATATDADDVQVIASLLGKLWCSGVAVDWAAWNKELDVPKGKRVSVPGYHFERTSFWVNPKASTYVDEDEASAPAPAPVKVVEANENILVRFGKANETPALRMYCLPFAGGSSRAFERWQFAHVDVVAVELRGRGGRIGEKHLETDADDAKQVEEIVTAIEADSTDTPFVLVGMSMGGLIACEVAMRLKEMFPKLLLGVAIAGRAPVRETALIPELELTDDTLSKYSLAPEELQQSEAWTSYLLPMLKSDLLSDTRTEKRLSRLQKPFLPELGMTVLCGTEDPIFKWDDADEWRDAVAGDEVRVGFMPGGHDFLTNHGKRIAEAVSKDALNWLIQLKTRELTAITSLKETITVPTVTPAPLYSIEWRQATIGETKDVAAVAYNVMELPKPTDVLEAIQEQAFVVYLDSAATHEDATASGWLLVKWLKELNQAGVGKGGVITLVLPKSSNSGFMAGASKAVPFEIPELRLRRAYTSQDTTRPSTHALCLRSLSAVADDDLDLDAKKAPKLVKSVALSQLKKAVPDTGHAFVVTGWTGGLGNEALSWMVKKGGVKPEHVVLMSRRQVEAPFAGMKVVVCSDLGNTEEVRRGLASCADVLRMPVGILHLAGALDDAMISNQTEAKYATAIGPKVGVLRSVYRALERPPQWVLAFSSTSSLFGYPGQANYCAANGYVDALTQWGGEFACKVTAISWGPWGEVGMAKKGTKAHTLALKDGDTPLATLPALCCLGHVMAKLVRGEETAAQYAVCDVDWNKSPWQDLPCLSAFKRAPSSTPVGQDAAAADESFAAQLRTWLLHEVDRTSWDAVMDEDMASLGLDSLDTVQLRNAFNKRFKKIAPLSLFSKPNLTMRSLHTSLTE
eukprot:TRINITY_DN7895_c4_g1_i2.p1 TRINITY_DN7895_c4_g1~~TRINITY_DN7895_c4_g1_i2.p1  ORF type:complete len:2605 (+),score=608.25 TRINITY_DN7895_c4_g1_i2:118-7932(+)